MSNAVEMISKCGRHQLTSSQAADEATRTAALRRVSTLRADDRVLAYTAVDRGVYHVDGDHEEPYREPAEHPVVAALVLAVVVLMVSLALLVWRW